MNKSPMDTPGTVSVEEAVQADELLQKERVFDAPNMNIEAAEPERWQKLYQAARRIVRKTVVHIEINPLTNELSRYGALTGVQFLTHNPVVGAAVLGGTTWLVEAGGAVAAAPIVTGEVESKTLNWFNRVLRKVVPADAKMSRTVEAGVALTLGTPLLMNQKQAEDPTRTTEEAKQYGLRAASLMSGLFAVEGALLSAGVGNYTDPRYVGAAAITTGAIWALPGTAKRRMEQRSGEMIVGKITAIEHATKGGRLTPKQIDLSKRGYEAVRAMNDESIELGLYGEDLEAALNDPDATLIEYRRAKRENVCMPLLVPAEKLTWYNMDLLKKTYGDATEFLYYAHPYIPDDETSKLLVAEALQSKLNDGAVIFMDHYLGRDPSEGTEQLISRLADANVMEKLGGGDLERRAEVFAGPGTFEGVDTVREAPSLYEVYQQAVADGELVEDANNGIAVENTIEGQEAEEIWEVYRKPFEDLGEDHPMHAGFTKEELLDILHDPGQMKVVKRVDGAIATLCFFVSDFDSCPWFNKKYYQDNYPEFYRTNNVFMFPGIVTDESKRGNDYSLEVIDLTTKLMAKRGTNVLITFECTEISATYIPKIVKAAIGNSGVAEISGLDQTISSMDYLALRKR